MAKSYIEKRIIKSGIELCENRIRMNGRPITPEDLREMKVKTLSPVVQIIYILLGCSILVLALWIHQEIANMAMSVMLLLVGVANIGYAIHGKPKPLSVLGDSINLMDLSAEIVQGFVVKSDSQLDK